MSSVNTENQFGLSPNQFEHVNCYLCGKSDSNFFIDAEDDLTGKPGKFEFVTCSHCRLTYQNPRLRSEEIVSYYDDEYIAHRKKKNWGVLTPFYNYAMNKHDREKTKIVTKYINLGKDSRVLDVGCAVGSFLGMLKAKFDVSAVGVDFKDLSEQVKANGAQFRKGTLVQQKFKQRSFDLISMWHFLEHDYTPLQTLQRCSELLKTSGRLVIEVPRLDSLSYRVYAKRWPGLQAPQHTLLFTKDTLLKMVQEAGLEVVDYLPWGAFPAYFYFFSGALFSKNKGTGVDFNRVIWPYYLGQQISKPLFAFEKKLNMAMQTVICKVPELPSASASMN